MENFRQKFLTQDESNFEALLKRLRLVHSLLTPEMSKGYSYFGQPQFDASVLEKFEHIPDVGHDSEHIMVAIADALTGQLHWNADAVMHNVNPPVTMDAIAAACVANIYNPNALWDFVSSGSLEMEQQVVRQISTLVGWNAEADGVFTFGGKGCLTYAVKLGLNRAVPDNAVQGLVKTGRKSPVVISSDESHYSLDTVCSLLGLGTANSIRIRTSGDGSMDLDVFRRVYHQSVDEGHEIAAVVINGGNTLSNCGDDLLKILPILKEREADLGYLPYIHYDMVITWPWLFFRDYDDAENKLDIEEDVLSRIRTLYTRISAARFADSVGVDFHKTGFSPYSSSLFVARDGAALHSVFRNELRREEMRPYGNNFRQHYTIEHSRSAAPIFSAWAALQGVGVEGFQSYIANLMRVAAVFRRELPKQGFECLSPNSLAFAGAYFPQYRGMSYHCVQAEECTEAVNDYVYRLFEFFFKGDHEYSKYILGYLPKAGRSHSGKDLCALRIFPMSAFVTPEKAVQISIELGALKALFDESYAFEPCADGCIRPKHVPV